MSGKKSKSVSDVLRQAIRESGLTHYRIAKDSGITPQMLDAFMKGDRTLRLTTLDKVAPVLGLVLRKA
jgi:transcriptional regulator with XRE-family HTH domain